MTFAFYIVIIRVVNYILPGFIAFSGLGIIQIIVLVVAIAPSLFLAKKAIEYAISNNSIISFDPNIRLPLWNSEEECKEAILAAGPSRLRPILMTSLTSIVLGPDAKSQRLQHIKLFPVDDHTAVAVFITNQGHTENKTFHFDDSVSVDDITNCCNILNDRLVGTQLSEVVDKMNEIKPILANQVKRHEALFNAFIQAFRRFASDHMYYSGATNMLYQPEFADIEKLKKLMIPISLILDMFLF